jgi:hypothetical protein
VGWSARGEAARLRRFFLFEEADVAEYKAIMTLALAGHSYSEIVAAVGRSRR